MFYTRIEHIVHHEKETCREVWHIATESIVRINGYVETIDIDSIIWCEELVDICVLVSFYLF